MRKYKTNQKIVFVCTTCAYLSGKTPGHLSEDAQWYQSTCDICLRKTQVTSGSSYGGFTAEQVKHAKIQLLELKSDFCTFASLKDVTSLMAVVDGVLGEHKSDDTKKVQEYITDKLTKGKPIEVYYVKKLTYHLTQDHAAMPKVETK